MINEFSSIQNHELICVVVDFGKGSKVIKLAKQNGANGATILLGKGTVNSKLLKILDLTEVRKEIVLMVSKKETINKIITVLNTKFKFDKPQHGIAFTIPIVNYFGQSKQILTKTKESGGLKNNMHQVIFVVVDKGKGESVVDSAISAGSRGATIINGRGSGIHEQKMLFSIPIEPEKEIVMILTSIDTAETIATHIRKDLKIDEPGMGILFTLPVNETYGLY